jgi:hypothetical protein
MNCINPRNVVAFTLLLFITLILFGSVFAQEKHKPLDPKAEMLKMSVPEIKLTVVLDSAFVKAKINRTQVVIDSLELQQKMYRTERKYWLDTIKIMRREK